MKLLIRRNQTLAILGIIVVLIALMGIPSSIKSVLQVILGLIIAIFGFLTHRRLEHFFTAFHDAREEYLESEMIDQTSVNNQDLADQK